MLSSHHKFIWTHETYSFLTHVQGPPTAEGPKNVATMKRKKGGKGKTTDGEGTAGEVLVMPFLSRFPLPSDGTQPDSEIAIKYVSSSIYCYHLKTS